MRTSTPLVSLSSRPAELSVARAVRVNLWSCRVSTCALSFQHRQNDTLVARCSIFPCYAKPCSATRCEWRSVCNNDYRGHRSDLYLHVRQHCPCVYNSNNPRRSRYIHARGDAEQHYDAVDRNDDKRLLYCPSNNALVRSDRVQIMRKIDIC